VRGGPPALGDGILCPPPPPTPQISLHESCRMGRRIVVMKLICSLGDCECDGHTVYKLSKRRLTADWLAPRKGNRSQMHSEVSSDWLPSYIKATQPVLEIFKMAGYFPSALVTWVRVSPIVTVLPTYNVITAATYKTAAPYATTPSSLTTQWHSITAIRLATLVTSA
jgi:hypothetical protein